MTLYEFKALTESEQIDIAWTYGEILDIRFSDEFKFILFQLHSFYVEIKSLDSINTISLKSFIADELLEPYLNYIDISNENYYQTF